MGTSQCLCASFSCQPGVGQESWTQCHVNAAQFSAFGISQCSTITSSHFVSEVHQIQNICTVSGLLLPVSPEKMLRSGLAGHPEGTVELKTSAFG